MNRRGHRLSLPAMMLDLLLVSALVMGLSHTITQERIFAPLRAKLGGKETWIGYLVSCPYCVSHWIALAVVPLTGTYPVRVVVGGGALAWLLSWFFASVLVAVIAAFLRIAFYFIDEAQSFVRRERQTIEQENEPPHVVER